VPFITDMIMSTRDILPILVDSHVNLHSEKYERAEIEELIMSAREKGVRYMVTISDQLSSTNAICDIIKAYDFIWRTVGVHPHHAKDYQSLSVNELIDLAKSSDVIGIGECGLDYHYEYSDRQFQHDVFSRHIEASQETQLPLVIHTREADDDMHEMLEKAYTKKKFTPLLHCYTSGAPLAKAALAMGAYISFSGIITFKNAHDVRAIVEDTPLDRIIIETDCPYLAPVPMRGRRNEPSYVVHVAQKLAEIKGVSFEEIAHITTQNFFRLFQRATRQIDKE